MDKTNIENLPHELLVTETVNFGLAGMTGEDPLKKVESALRNLPGIKEVSIDRTGPFARVTFDSSVIDVPTIHDAILGSGYKPPARTNE
jgi:copper chaperone CopZ